MDEEWDIHSSTRPSIRQVIDLDKRDYDSAMQALELDPNADQLTQFDQQWARESIKYTGMQTSRNGIPMQQNQNPSVTIGVFVVMTVLTFGLFFAGLQTSNGGFYCFSLFLLIFVVILGFIIRQQLRFAQAKKHYLAQRAILITNLGLKPGQIPPAPVIEKPLIHKSITTSAASQIRQLQYHYHGIKDQEQYRHSVLSIIAHAPEQERPYLKALAAIEAEWVQERLKYVRFKNASSRQRLPRLVNQWFVVIFCGIFVGLGLNKYLLAVNPLSVNNLIGLLAFVVMPTMIAIDSFRSNQRVKQYRALEAQYAERRNQLHGRFRDRAPF